MKATLKYLFSMILAFCCVFSVTSCGKDEPEPLPKKSLTINGKEVVIQSAGYYHNIGQRGYEFVVSSEELDMTNEIEKAPSGFLLAMDIPEKYYGSSFDVKEIADDIGEDGIGWYFFLSYLDDDEDRYLTFLDNEDIESGTVLVEVDNNGIANIEINLFLTGNIKLGCEYFGQIQKSSNYICSW